MVRWAGRGRPPEGQEDLLLEVMFKISAVIREARVERERQPALFYGIVRNKGYELFRKFKSNRRESGVDFAAIELTFADARRTPEEIGHVHDRERLVGRLCGCLGERERFVIREWMQSTPDPEIAKALNTSRGNVQQIRHRAIEKMTKLLRIGQ
jgi:RNA polymerase sigma factor (sigma-70 family)